MRTGRRRLFFLSTVMLIALAAAVFAWRQQWDDGTFVEARGERFVLDGRTFRFVGANMYNAAGDPEIYQCGPWMENPDEELNRWFEHARRDFGGRVIRFWAFQSYTKGGEDWRALDRVMRVAKAHDLRVIPVLENQWLDCTEGGVKADSWYAGGYLKPYGGYPLSYKEYVRRVVSRYRDEPAVFAWMLLNEAESKTPRGEGNPAPLYDFTRDMSAYVKSLDSRHLLTLGVLGSGQGGVAGEDYARLHALPALDFLEYHDYNREYEALPGAPDAPPDTLAAALATARRLDKPLLIGEAGITTCVSVNGSEVVSPRLRAQVFDAKIGAFFEAGGAGYLAWAWDPVSDCDHNFATGDPLNAVLLYHARLLRRQLGRADQ